MSNRRWTAAFLVVCAGLLAPCAAIAQWNPPNPVVSFDKQTNGIEIHQKDGVLKFEVDAPDVLHVTYSPLDASQPARPSDHVVIKTDWPVASFDVSESDKAITLTTAKLKVAIERQSGSIHYQGADGKQLTTDTYRMLHPAEVNGEQTFHAEVAFGIYGSHEGFYGLGPAPGRACGTIAARPSTCRRRTRRSRFRCWFQPMATASSGTIHRAAS